FNPPFDPPARNVVGEESHGSVAVGEEVDAAADPDRVEVGGIAPRNLDRMAVGQPRYPDRRGPAAAVALEGEVLALQWHVGQSCAVRREPALLAHRKGKRRLE